MGEVVTGEAVVLEVPCARFPSRLLAIAIDMIIQIVVLVVLFGIAGATGASGLLNPASAGALAVVILVLVIVGYPVIWESLTRGRSPGKFALGLRVVGDDGGPERFRQALVRGLAAAVEIWALAGCPALICSLLSERGKRLGDLFAGTFVLQQRLPARLSVAAVPAVAPELAGWAAALEMSQLTEQTAETARRYLARLGELTPAARAELGERIAATVRAQVSPPPPSGVTAAAYLATVIAERRNREQARFHAWAPAGRPAPEAAPPAGSVRAVAGVGPYGAEPGTGRPPAHDPAPSAAPGAPPAAQGTESAATRRAEDDREPSQPPASGPAGFVPPA